MTTQNTVSEELVKIALEAEDWKHDALTRMRAALNAIAPRLRAEGMREARAQGRVEGMQTIIDRYIEGGLWNWETRTALEEILAKVRADALDPPPQQEEKE